ncbi:MAG TPA: hypothetical protein VGN72_16465 [Tepidisphaeraceae bacterium]|jgi:hypothetical protein|nr:hypothetical protein [Tepidisphaeraceae bacterium]
MAEIYSTGPTAVLTNANQQRISWGAIFAGLVTALGTMLLLTVLGIAIGLSSVDANDDPRNFGLGAGIWGAISALVSFFVGGWVAGWGKPAGHTASGLAQGIIMWMVAMVLLVYMIAGGIGSIFRTAGSVASTGVQAVSNSADAVTGTVNNDPELREQAAATTQQATNQIQQAAQEARQAVTPQNVERVADNAATGAWGTLISLILSLAAAAVGGLIGAKSHDDGTRRRD